MLPHQRLRVLDVWSGSCAFTPKPSEEERRQTHSFVRGADPRILTFHVVLGCWLSPVS